MTAARRASLRAEAPWSPDAEAQGHHRGLRFRPGELPVDDRSSEAPRRAAALNRVLRLPPGEAPAGEAPATLQAEEIGYLDQLRRVYGEARGSSFQSVDAILVDAEYGPDLGDHRTRFFEASVFKRFHRDNTEPGARRFPERRLFWRHRHPSPRPPDRVRTPPCGHGSRLAHGDRIGGTLVRWVPVRQACAITSRTKEP